MIVKDINRINWWPPANDLTSLQYRNQNNGNSGIERVLWEEDLIEKIIKFLRR